MILLAIVALPLLAGILAWGAERFGPAAPRWLAAAALAADAALVLWLWVWPAPGTGSWVAEAIMPWMPRFGIAFHLAADGLSLLMLLLSALLGVAAVACSWTEIRERVGFFHFCLLWSLAGAMGVFLAMDLFLFFFFWEAMLVPMYFLIAIWGHERRHYAAIKFFLFTQGSGLLMLVSIVVLAIAHYRATGLLSFDYFDLLGGVFPPDVGFWLMLGFFLAFAVKLPVVPFHTWLADAHTEAPTAGSVILAGVLLKTGAYGLLRFTVPLFPAAALAFAPVAMALGVVGILYGALLAFGQHDLKRLVAYTSVSHMGFVLLGIFAWNAQALNGAVIQMLAHGLSTGALFVLVGALQERTGTRDLGHLGGLWAAAPRLSAWGLFLAVAALGLPGLGNFVGEFLVLLGTFQRYSPFAVAAALGLVGAAAYALIMVQRAFHGENRQGWQLADCNGRETAIMVALAAGIVGIGVFPQPLLATAGLALSGLQRLVGAS
ncbi:MAG: dehydrogenase subunit [Rhodocyclaceae bacterium]|nr:dehydrogenase subunit [Rhodocyclaceae bacterium]